MYRSLRNDSRKKDNSSQRTQFELLAVAEPLESEVGVADGHAARFEVGVLHLNDVSRPGQRHSEDGLLELLHDLRPLLWRLLLQRLQLGHRLRVLRVQDDAGLSWKKMCGESQHEVIQGLAYDIGHDHDGR